MSDPPRLLDRSASPLASRLLRAGLNEQPSRAIVRRTLTAVGAGIAIASSTTAATAGSGAIPVTLLAIAKWVGLGALGGLVTLTAATQLGAPRARTIDSDSPIYGEEVPTLHQGSKPEAKGADTFDQPIVKSDTALPPSLPLVELHEKPAPSFDLGRSIEPNAPYDPSSLAAPVAPPVSPPAPLAEEVSFVDRGWAGVRSKQYAHTLADLAVYERKFPNMSMLPEVLFLRMQAESGLGNAERAKAHANSILSRFPQSPHSARARDVLQGK